MGSINYRPAGLNIQTEIPTGGLNDAFVDIQEVLLLETGKYRRNRLDTLDLAEEPTLQDWWGDPTKTDKEIWDLAVAAGYVVRQLTMSNVMAVSTAIIGVADADVYRAKFIGNNIAEIRRDKGLTEFIVPAVTAYPLFRASGWNPSTPIYDDTAGTALSRIITLQTYFIAIIECGLEDQTLPAPIKIKTTGISFNDWSPSDIPGLHKDFKVRNVGGTLKFCESVGDASNLPTNAVVGLNNGRKVAYIPVTTPATFPAVYTHTYTTNLPTIVAIAQITNNNKYYGESGNYMQCSGYRLKHFGGATADGYDITPTLAPTYATDGYSIAIWVLNPDRAVAASGGKLLPGTKVWFISNQNGVLNKQEFTIPVGKKIWALGSPHIGPYNSTEYVGEILHYTPTRAINDQDMQNMFDYYKKFLSPQ